jgi:predicted site-specific integrase-resolvase
MSYVSTRKAQEYYGVTSQTLRNWSDMGKIKYRRTTGGHRVYIINEQNENKESKRKIIYIRVSSHKQKDDLERQKDYMLERFPDYEVIKDIGSGLNFKRKGLISILDESEKGNIGKIVVYSKDRLCRFGFELLEYLFRKYSVELLVLNNKDKSPAEEMSEDILSVVQVFACKWNGKRKYKARILSNEENRNKANSETKEDSETME